MKKQPLAEQSFMNLSNRAKVIFSNSNSWVYTKTGANLLYIIGFIQLNAYGNERYIMIRNY